MNVQRLAGQTLAVHTVAQEYNGQGASAPFLLMAFGHFLNTGERFTRPFTASNF